MIKSAKDRKAGRGIGNSRRDIRRSGGCIRFLKALTAAACLAAVLLCQGCAAGSGASAGENGTASAEKTGAVRSGEAGAAGSEETGDAAAETRVIRVDMGDTADTGDTGDTAETAGTGMPPESGSSEEHAGDSSAGTQKPEKHTDAPETFSFLFAGDILFDPSYSAGTAFLTGGASGCFDAEALKMMREADVFVVNNEFAYTSGGTAVSKEYNFRTAPEHASILNDMGADLVLLGNNHTYDYGETGLLDTLDALEKAGVPYIGAGRNQEQAERPAVYDLGGFRVSLVNAESILFNNSPPAQSARGEKPGTFDCYRPEMLFEAVRKAKEQSDFCIVLVHWGSEGKTTPNEKQKILSKGAAEAGADLIIGGHPHVLQGIGSEGTVPVFYSLGNYLFHSGVQDTCLVEAVFRPDGKRLESLRFIPMQCRNLKVITLTGGEKERLLDYMRKLSPGVTLDEEGYLSFG